MVADKALGCFYYSKYNQASQPKALLNTPIIVEYKLLEYVVTSIEEVETATLFYNCQTVIDIQNMLHAIGHLQKFVLVKTDSSRATSFVTRII